MKSSDLFSQRHSFYLKASPALKGGLATCFFIAALTIAAGILQDNPARLWGAFLLNLFFFFSISLGGVAFGSMQDAIGALWGRPIKRLHEGFGAFLPVAGLLFLVFFGSIATGIGGAQSVYSWIVDPSIVAGFYGKNVWLEKNFMLVRDTAALALLLALATWQMRLASKRDQAFAAGHQDQSLQLGRSAQKILRYWSSPSLIVYAFCFSLLAFDLLMTLNPLWFSTLWAGWLFSIMMQTLMATLLITMYSVKKSPLGQFIQRQQFHDVGKLMHGFTIFFAYLTYAHILTYWYGNVPEETEYFLLRLEQPWFGLICVIPILGFVLPLFVLIFKSAKWTAQITLPVCGSILVAQWMVYLVVITPEVSKPGMSHGPWMELGLFAGFLGLFLASFTWYGSRVPMLGLADPLLAESIDSGHH